MIGILVAIAFAVWYFITAKKIGKNPIMWAAIGLAAYYGAVLIYSLILRVLLSNMKIRISSSSDALAYGLGVGLSAVAVGALSAYYIRKKFLLNGGLSNPSVKNQQEYLTNHGLDNSITNQDTATSNEDLDEQLFKVLDGAWIWGKANNHPSLEEYPQFNDIRRLGEKFALKSGKEGMQAALLKVKEVARPVEKARSGSEYLGGYTALAEKAWVGIENWC